MRYVHAAVALLAITVLLAGGRVAAEPSLLNVSYDPTREFYAALNKAFAEDWKAKTGETITLRNSHGGSGAHAPTRIYGLHADVAALDSGARGATMSFAQRRQGDVLIAWENEAFLAANEFGKDKLEIVVPSVSILAEPPVALVDANVDRHGTRKAAEAYLAFLYSPQGQEIAARNFYRPRLKEVAERYGEQFARIPLFTVDELFGGWRQAQATHFADGGVFDQIYKPGK